MAHRPTPRALAAAILLNPAPSPSTRGGLQAGWVGTCRLKFSAGLLTFFGGGDPSMVGPCAHMSPEIEHMST